ncbi:sulfatase-like hydrolase/transferase [Fulvivirgaceae bacterium BMA10]|uniref:Sulfatase-like hydrolase/transferase n=1 Tax=Splendidivirga corallicola TaxID=3051826 RepID=A0ABT8KSB2_9BACT|nr:sulfatase-like hydrolase/transferase [Fulvivirgaceae bacterium BMA10]
MEIKKHLGISLVILCMAGVIGISSCEKKYPKELPNILWIVSEDNSPFLGCYGDTLATTPNLDKLASGGNLYTHAYANTPVCAPARNTIITGVYANSSGNQHMRSKYQKSEIVNFFPKYLRNLGYYCTNNAKEDYNTIKPDSVWDESSNQAHYQNRKGDQPFFHIFNIGISHESSIHKSVLGSELKHDPDQMVLPPYHPDTEEMRHDWAQYYDKISTMDERVGSILKELEENGLAENTIVFYYSDHGGVLGRSKRYVYESGTRVPFIIRVPEKYKHLRPGKNGEAINRMISFVDLAPTMLSLTGIPIPDYMQGNAFLGPQKSEDPEYAFMFRGRMDERYDMSRAVRDHKFRYIHNYMPYRIYGQALEYLWRAPSMKSWEKAYHDGKCDTIQSIFWNTKPVEELYDTENDPWEVTNLAEKPEYKEVLLRMRKANLEWIKEIKDVGFIPESEYEKNMEEMSMFDHARANKNNIEENIEAAEYATYATKETIPQLVQFLSNDNSATRYWGATGLLILGDEAKSAIPALKEALHDTSPGVVTVASEALYNLGEYDDALSGLKRALQSENTFARTHALNAIDCLELDDRSMIEAVVQMIKDHEKMNRSQYDLRAAKFLLEKWNVDPANYGLAFSW